MSKIITRPDLRAHLNLTYRDTTDDSVMDSCISGAESFVFNFVGFGSDQPDLTPEPADPAAPYTNPASTFDGAIKSATLMLASHFWQNREAAIVSTTRTSVAELPLGIYDLLTPLRANFAGAALW